MKHKPLLQISAFGFLYLLSIDEIRDGLADTASQETHKIHRAT